MSSSQDKTIELRHLWRVVWRRKGILLLSILSVLCAALIGLQTVPEQYRSSVDLTIEQRETLSNELEQVLGVRRDRAALGLEERRLSQVIGSVTSTQFLERVVKVLRMHEDPRLLALARKRQERHPELTVEEVAIRILVKSLKARVQVQARGAGLFRFSVSDYDPETSRLLAQWISELFIDETTKRELDRIQAARLFSQEQLRIYQEEVDRAESALRAYRESLIGNALENNPVRSDNLSRAEDVASQLREEEKIARDRVGSHARAAIQAGLPAEDPTLRENSEIRRLADDVSSVLRRLARARVVTDGRDPAVAALNTELVQARNALYQTLEERARRLYSDNADWTRMADLAFAQLDAEAHGKAATAMDVLLLDFKRRVRAEPGHELELTRLADEVARKRQLLESFEKQMVASELQQRVETTDLGLQVEIIDRAQLPLEPYWPDRTRVILLALILGPVLGVGLAFLAEILDPTLRSLEDISRVAPEPVLGTLPLVDGFRAEGGMLRRRWVPVTMVGVVIVTAVFFLAKDRVFPDLGVPRDAVSAVEPSEAQR
jgi:uncharacterized protein involved in exopolysaccharide biosynthesis